MTWHWPFLTIKCKCTTWRSGESFTMSSGSCTNQILRSTKNVGNLWIPGVLNFLSHTFSDIFLLCCALNLVLFNHYLYFFYKLSSITHTIHKKWISITETPKTRRINKPLFYSFYHIRLVFLHKVKKIKNHTDYLTLSWRK